MRRSDREVTDMKKIMEILEKCDCCRLGFVDSKGAYIVPLNFGYEQVDGVLTLYFHGATVGKKLDLIREQKMATFELDTKHELVANEIACNYTYLYQCIMGRGNIEIVEDRKKKIHGLQRIMAHYSKKKDWEFQEEHIKAVAVFKLEVKELSCKEH